MLSHESLERSESLRKKDRAKGFYLDIIQNLEDLGGKISTRINVINDVVDDKGVIVRREHPVKLFQLITGHEPLSIRPDDGLVYANAVEWKPSKGSVGLATAFTEGFGEYEGLVTVIGFKKNRDMNVVYPRGLASYQAGMDRDLVRCVQGEMFLDDLRFVIFRIPADRFPIEEMTLVERDKYEDWLDERETPRKPFYIFRAVTFSSEEKKNDPFRSGLAA